MCKPANFFRIFVLATIASTFLSCGVNEPERYLRPPVIKTYAPASSALRTVVGDTLRFSITAVDPDNQDLYYYYMLGDSMVTKSPSWTYVVEDTGDIDVGGHVSDGVSVSEIRWYLERIQATNLPPVINRVVPPESEVTITIGGSIDFTIAAIDPEGQQLSYFYWVNDTIKGVSRHFTYTATYVGMADVRAVVTDGESSVSHSWAVRIAAEPDSILPAPVTVVSLGPGPETGEIDVEWIAVGDDSMDGLPSHYIVRTSTKPITDEYGWTTASDRPGEPDPLPPGEIQHMVIGDLHPAQVVHVAVRAVDDFGNMSELSDSTSAQTRGMKISGTIRDALTNDPIPGIRVNLVRSADTTGIDGTYVLAELPAGSDRIFVRDEEIHTEYGDYFDVIVLPYEIVDKDVVDFWLLPNVALEATDYTSFLMLYHAMTELEGNYENRLGRWNPPCHVYVPQHEANNLDYQQVVKGIYEEWENAIGIDIFDFVEAAPDTGIYVVFEDSDDNSSFTVIQRDPLGLPVLGRMTIQTAYSDTTLSTLEIIVRHEVGHALRMHHSSDDKHIMVGVRFPAVTHPSIDEIRLGQAMYHIPRGFPAAWFVYD